MTTKRKGQAQALSTAAQKVAIRYGADTLLFSGPIDNRGFALSVASILAGARREKCLLILTTQGGDLHAAYQLVRFLHDRYARLVLCVPGFCKSAGALIAVGAHELVLDVYSELGPIADELGGGAESGEAAILSIAEAYLEWATRAASGLSENIALRPPPDRRGRRTPSEAARSVVASMLQTLVEPMAASLTPAAIGRQLRRLALADAYCRRVADHAANTREGTVERLIYGYPSHDFIIDLAEARTLFRRIAAPAPPLYALLDLLGERGFTPGAAASVQMLARSPDPSSRNTAGIARPKKSRRRSSSSGTAVAPPTRKRGASRPVRRRRKSAR